jgi:hypothetical protein
VDFTRYIKLKKEAQISVLLDSSERQMDNFREECQERKGLWLQREKLGKPVWHARKESLEKLLEYMVVPRALGILT